MKVFKTKRWLNSKSFWGSLLFAVALWGYTSLNTEFISSVELPLYIKLPVNRALEQEPEQSIGVNVKGSGWHLFNMFLFNNSKNCTIDLTDYQIDDSVFVIDKNEIQKGIRGLSNVTATEIWSKPIQIITGKIIQKKIPIFPNISVMPAEGFTVVGKLKVEPEYVIINGNENVVKKIEKWFTQFAEYDDKNKSFSTEVNILDSLVNVVNVYPQKVRISAEIQQEAEITIDDVPIQITRGSLPASSIISPNLISVTLRGGVDELAKLSVLDISAVIDFDSIIKDSTGILYPQIKLPENIELIGNSPRYLYHHLKIDKK